MRKKILWISRHPLWSGQRALLHSIHGKKCTIEERNFRFQNFEHFLDFLEEFHKRYYIYVVVPEKWKETAVEMGYSFGTIHKPQRGQKEGRRHILFRIDFFGTQNVCRTRKKVLNSKGCEKPKGKKKN